MLGEFRIQTVAFLMIVIAVHGPWIYAEEPDGHADTQTTHQRTEADHSHTHTPGGRTPTDSRHAHTPQGYDLMEEIIVTADPLGDVDSHVMMPVKVLGKDELETRSIRNIGEAVANELGVSTSDFGTAVGRPVIRSLAGSRVGILENGTSTMDVSNIGADHAVPTEPASARQIEIFRGPATLLFGSGASGGVINVVNDRILKYVPKTLEGEISIQYETVSEGVNGAGMTYFKNPWYASVNFTRVNKQNDTAPFESSTRGYVDLNLYASYRISHGDYDVTLFASASNLLDEEKRRHTSFVKDLAPMPGRSGIFGVRVSF